MILDFKFVFKLHLSTLRIKNHFIFEKFILSSMVLVCFPSILHFSVTLVTKNKNDSPVKPNHRLWRRAHKWFLFLKIFKLAFLDFSTTTNSFLFYFFNIFVKHEERKTAAKQHIHTNSYNFIDPVKHAHTHNPNIIMLFVIIQTNLAKQEKQKQPPLSSLLCS